MATSHTASHTAILALGSNLGDRAAHLHTALREMRAYLTVEATSFLYETPPAYVTDQPKFLNAVCRVTTQLSPQDLLAAIEATMSAMGRVRTLRYGPRIIDIDILFYDRVQLVTPDLTIPHPRLPERDFVLEPLCDIAADFRHPLIGLTMRDLLTALKAPPLPRILPLGNTLWTWGAKTYVMGIINVTPDSFSGDGLAGSEEGRVAAALAQAERFLADGADCLDVGGMSTRPGHALIPIEEELGRVIPVVQALAQRVAAPISVDTFRREVAQAALDAGAQLVNDVWGLRYDRELARLVADRGAALTVMHNRMRPEEAGYRARVASLPVGPPNAYDDIARDITHELEQSLAFAEASGVPRWLLVADPGLGFGKNTEQQLELIHRLSEVRALGYPLLFGPSRKRFIGQVLGDLPPQERVEGTLAACVLAIDRGADIIRVHDVRAAARAARLADAVVRGPWAG
jgi:dihydroneopterin aldolase / 2-amino-4-hydroxy-6-hydroxymethyldihydropteridine diphosphokinase / dihydropteroate synthase